MIGKIFGGNASKKLGALGAFFTVVVAAVHDDQWRAIALAFGFGCYCLAQGFGSDVARANNPVQQAEGESSEPAV